MKTHPTIRRGFTLMETVIAIGVLAVLLTAFMAVFGPAATAIRKSVSAQEADRLVSSLEEELAILRTGQTGTTAFDKAFTWILNASKNPAVPIMIYQYRAMPSASSVRADGTMPPYTSKTGTAGTDYVLQTGVRLRSDTLFSSDLAAVEGPVFAVLTTQLVFKNGQLVKGTAGVIADPVAGSTSSNSDQYPSAVIAFSADFYLLPSSAPAYLQTGGTFNPATLATNSKPVFTRNLAVRR